MNKFQKFIFRIFGINQQVIHHQTIIHFNEAPSLYFDKHNGAMLMDRNVRIEIAHTNQFQVSESALEPGKSITLVNDYKIRTTEVINNDQPIQQ